MYRKMRLVPAEYFAQKQREEALLRPVAVKRSLTLDDDMRGILNDSNLDVDVKLALYNQTLSKYLANYAAINPPAPPRIAPKIRRSLPALRIKTLKVKSPRKVRVLRRTPPLLTFDEANARYGEPWGMATVPRAPRKAKKRRLAAASKVDAPQTRAAAKKKGDGARFWAL